MAYLGSPKVQISRSDAFLAKLAGLSNVVDMWRAAQAHREHIPTEESVLHQMAADKEASVRRALAGIQCSSHTVTMTDSRRYNIEGVVAVTKVGLQRIRGC